MNYHNRKNNKLMTLVALIGSFSMLTSCTLLRPSKNIPEYSTEKEESREITIDTLETEETVHPEDSIDDKEIIMDIDRPARAEAIEWIELYNKKHGKDSADDVIMDHDSISEYNQKLIKECHTLHDMNEPPESMLGSDVRREINRYTIPTDERNDRHNNRITAEMREAVSENCGLDKIPDEVEVRYGIITNRCDLRGFPTELGFYDVATGYYSGIQECELITGFPVIILHESNDGGFYFVRSYYYCGWISSSCVALTNREEYLNHQSPDNFITILSPEIKVNDTALSMGCTLRYVSEDKDCYYAEIPNSDENGELIYKTAEISKTNASFGYLPYTMKNYYRQAFEYLGTPYCWGGENGGVDCSGFVCTVFRTFGIYLPRNTSEQEKYNGEVISFASNNATDVLDGLNYPTSVHRKGHVMLYLGKKNGQHYIIHAPQGGETICVTSLSLPGTLTNVCVITDK